MILLLFVSYAFLRILDEINRNMISIDCAKCNCPFNWAVGIYMPMYNDNFDNYFLLNPMFL